MMPALLAALCLPACAPPAPAISAQPPPAREVSVTATARLNVAPDEAEIALTFSHTAPTMRRAHDAATEAMQRFTLAAERAGIGADRMERGRISDSANRRWDGTERVTGYTAAASLVLRLPDFDRVADTVDLAVSSGATDISVSYRATDLPARKQEVRDMAIQAARAKAAQLATGSGARLGAIQRISEEAGNPWRYAGVGNAVQTERPEPEEGVAIAPGTVPLEVTVAATFLLE